jgi:hypothetical protein
MTVAPEFWRMSPCLRVWHIWVQGNLTWVMPQHKWMTCWSKKCAVHFGDSLLICFDDKWIVSILYCSDVQCVVSHSTEKLPRINYEYCGKTVQCWFCIFSICTISRLGPSFAMCRILQARLWKFIFSDVTPYSALKNRPVHHLQGQRLSSSKN